MEFKRNEATRNRPEGDRVLDAPYVFVDTAGYIEQIKDEKQWAKTDRNAITVFKSTAMTAVLSALKPNAEVVDNTVEGWMTIEILEGIAKISTPDGDVEARQHQMMFFHPNIKHSITAMSDVILLIINYSTDSKLEELTSGVGE